MCSLQKINTNIYMKKLLLLSIFALSFSNLNAQNYFTSSIGVSYSQFSNNQTLATATSFGIAASPRINVLEFTDGMSLSAGTHLEFGYLIQSELPQTYDENTQTYFGEKAPQFLVNVPLVAELNFGKDATEDNENSFGGYFGGGVSGLYMKEFIFAPTVNAGLRFGNFNLELGYLLGENRLLSFGFTTVI